MKKELFGFRFSVFSTRVKPQKGFTLLISVLIASILLALGFAIYNIVSKEILLSSAGRESQFAFYAADSGIECALYWDVQGNAFATSSSVAEVFCGGATSTVTRIYDAPLDALTAKFSFNFGGTLTNPCASVTVVRQN